MNREIRDKWTAALRSGKYRQGRGALRNIDDELCCLGLLCELAVAEGVIPHAVRIGTVYRYGGVETAYLPESVQRWAGLDDAKGRYGNTSLSINNDCGVAFPQIADIIEANF